MSFSTATPPCDAMFVATANALPSRSPRLGRLHGGLWCSPCRPGQHRATWVEPNDTPARSWPSFRTPANIWTSSTFPISHLWQRRASGHVRPGLRQRELSATLATLAEHGLKPLALDGLPSGGFRVHCPPQKGKPRSFSIKNSTRSCRSMTKVDLKGIAKVRAKGRVYYYAWRGGPRLKGQPGSPEFLASYHDAHQGRRQPSGDQFRTVICAYRGSPEYLRLAPSTRRQWAPWLDRIAEHFGELRIRQFDRADKIRPVIRQWRNRYASTRGRPTSGSRSFRASSPSPSIRSAKSSEIPAKASSNSIEGETAPR